MTRTERSFIRSYDKSWRKRRGRSNVRTDQEIIQAIKVCRTHKEAEERLGVAHATFHKYLHQLRDKGLLDKYFKPIQ